jgi:hypothetical protein
MNEHRGFQRWLLFGTVLLVGLAIGVFVMAQPRPCAPRSDDPDGYLFAICQYIREQQIDVAPADPTAYTIKRIEEASRADRPVLLIFLNCCYLGDVAVIDKTSGQVIDFRPGAK